MIPKTYSEFFEVCNETIVALEECIKKANSCAQNCAIDGRCAAEAQGFIATVHQCIASCENCVKAATALLAEFHFEGHEEHKETIDHCVKALGEAITICNASIEICGDLSKCRVACREALDACDRALEACDECFESCEKHSVFYEQPKKS